MPAVDLNLPSAGELLGTAAPLKDGSKGARNVNVIYRNRGLIDIPPKKKYEQRRLLLDVDRESWRPHWLDVKNYFLPYRTKYLDDGGLNNRGTKKMSYIVDNTPIISLRTLRAGFLSSMTNPSRPWLHLKPQNDAIAQADGVAEWCAAATSKTLQILARSNFYRAMSPVYDEIGGFGTGALDCHEVEFDPRKRHQPLVNFVPYTIGEYWIAQNEEGRVDTFYRLFSWTVRQVVMKFVSDPMNPSSPDWGKLSPSTRALWQQRQWDKYVEVVNCVEPNEDYDSKAFGSKSKPFKSVYYERGSSDDFTLLDEKGRDYGVHVARWDLNSGDTWGHSPAMDALGDAKALMIQQKRKAQAIDKQVDPPLIGDANLKKNRISQLPGEVNWLETSGTNTVGLKPLYELKPDLTGLLQDIQATTKRISDAMYTNVFKTLESMSDELKSNITATEIQARKQEQLLELGPLVDRLNGEMFEPMIDQVFDIMVRRSLPSWRILQAGGELPPSVESILPPPPKALAGQKLVVEYTSVLAQAMKVAEVQGIQQLTTWVGQIAEGGKPEAWDKINLDKCTEIMGDRWSVPPSCIVAQDKVDQQREARAQAQQQQVQHEQAMNAIDSGSQAAKNLSDAKVGKGNALEALANAQPQGNA